MYENAFPLKYHINDNLIVNQNIYHKLFLSKLKQSFHSVPTVNIIKKLKFNLILYPCRLHTLFFLNAFYIFFFIFKIKKPSRICCSGNLFSLIRSIRTSLVTDKRVYTNSCLSMLGEEPRGQGKH